MVSKGSLERRSSQNNANFCHIVANLKMPMLKNTTPTGDLTILNKPLVQKAWKLITWRWRLQLAMNVPFGLLWVADKNNPSVHAFDMKILAAIHAEWLAPMMGIQ